MGRSQGPGSAGRALAAGSAQHRPGKALFLSRGRRPPRGEQSGRRMGIPAPVPAQASCAASEAAGDHHGGVDADRKYSTENVSFFLPWKPSTIPAQKQVARACSSGEWLKKQVHVVAFSCFFLFQSSWSL